jgi:hypothetical protein
MTRKRIGFSDVIVCALMFPFSFFNQMTEERTRSGHRFQLPRRKLYCVAAAYIVDYFAFPPFERLRRGRGSAGSRSS